MANPIIKIKNGHVHGAYANNGWISNTTYLNSLEDGELAYNAWNNGLYIGYNGTNYLLSVTNGNSDYMEPQHFFGTADKAEELDVDDTGSSTVPIYFVDGKPKACGSSLSVNISKNAATATKWKNEVKFSINDEAGDSEGININGDEGSATLIIPKKIKGFNEISAKTFNGEEFTGTAAQANALTTACRFDLTTAVDADHVDFDGTNNVTLQVNSVKEAYLTWGGRHLKGSVSPIDAATSSVHSANRFQFAKPAGIVIEYSRDGGNTWSDYGASDSDKVKLVSNLGTSFTIGQRSGAGVNTVNDQLRVTLNATNMGVYTLLRKLLINITTNYAKGSTLKIEKAMKGSETTFKEVGSYEIAGWSGWNSIPINNAFGGGATQTSNIAILKLTFSITGVGTTAQNSALTLMDIVAIGETYWAAPSTMAKTGHLYTYDVSQNVIFPKNISTTGTISADTFSGTLSTSNLNGIVPVTKGGTGTSFNPADEAAKQKYANAIVRFSSDTSTLHFSPVYANVGALCIAKTGDTPSFKTLPVNCGGTGNTSYSKYRLVSSSTTGGSLISTSQIVTDGTRLHVNHIPTGMDSEEGTFEWDKDPYLDSSYKLYVGGPSKLASNLTVSGNTYLSGALNIENDIYITEESSIHYKCERNKTGSGGWAYNIAKIQDNANTTFVNIGVFGNANTLTYMYLGSGDYNSATNFRIHNNGDITIQGDSNFNKNIYIKGANPLIGFKNSSNTIKGYLQYQESSDDFSLGKDYNSSLRISNSGSISIPANQSITTRTDNTGSVGTSNLNWAEVHSKKLISSSILELSSVNDMSFTAKGDMTLSTAGDLKLLCGPAHNIYAHNLLPEHDMEYSLGSEANTWANVYSRYYRIQDGANDYNGGCFYTEAGKETSTKKSYLLLGNSTATGSAGNRQGIVRLFSSLSSYQDLCAHPHAANSQSDAASSRITYLRDYGDTAYLAATLTRNQIGSTRKPVYVTTSGVIVSCNIPTDGDYWNGVVNVTTEGASNIGKYLDFHTTSDSMNNYDTRIQSTGSASNTIYLPEVSGQFVIHTNDTAEGDVNLPIYIESTGKAKACTPSSIFSDFTSSGNTLSITVTGQTRTASIVNSISNTWTNGTTSGPTLKTTVNGVAGTAVAIPSATGSISGVVTTGTQTFAGTKTIHGNLVVTNADSTSTTARSVKATNANGSVGVYQSTNRGLYDFTENDWIIYSDTSNGNAPTVSSRLYVPYLTVTGTASGEHIKFSRAGYNYITYPSGGTVAINCGSSLGEAYSQLLINESSVRSGTGASLGTSDNRWNGVYGRSFHAKNSSASSSNGSFTVENYDGSCSISLLYGSGQSNTGIYDNKSDQWMIYRALGDDTELKRKTTRFPGGVAFTSSHGTGTPGTSTAGYGVTGAVYFKRI